MSISRVQNFIWRIYHGLSLPKNYDEKKEHKKSAARLSFRKQARDSYYLPSEWRKYRLSIDKGTGSRANGSLRAIEDTPKLLFPLTSFPFRFRARGRPLFLPGESFEFLFFPRR